MPYHVTVHWPRARSSYVFNLEDSEVRQRFVEPWTHGLPIVVKGQQYNAGYWQVTIVDHASVPDRGNEIEKWVHVKVQGLDVTDDFITAPYGSARISSPTLSSAEESPHATRASNPRSVMVIHGRNLTIRDSMFELLRALDLMPMEWSQLVSLTGEASPYIGQILEQAFGVAQAAVVVFSPDDEARLAERLWAGDEKAVETELRGQARSNVFFEAGLAFGRFPEKTILVEVGQLRPASDLAGRHVIRLDNGPERRQELAQRLEDAGCPVNRSGTDWLRSGNFELA
jgi:predicted nucleotide-binding protein